MSAKGNKNMNRRMSNRLGLLSRVSSIAIIAAAGSFGAAQQAEAACVGNEWATSSGTTINASCDHVVVDQDTTNVTVNGGVNIGPGGEGNGIPFDVYNDITGTLTNNGSIFGGFTGGETAGGAVTIHNSATLGSLINNHSIQSDNGHAVQIGNYFGSDQGFVTNGIFNYDSISSGENAGIAALSGTFAGGLHNGSSTDSTATINGGLAGVYIDSQFGGEGTDWAGGIDNYGQITGGEAGILMGFGGSNETITFAGGITNQANATISSTGGIGIEITDDVYSFTDGISNSGEIEGPNGGINIQSTYFSGGLFNNGGATIEGGVPGSGGGEGGEGGGEGVLADAIYADTIWSGNFTNNGTVTGTDDAFQFYGEGGDDIDFTGNVTNNGSMTSGADGSAIEFDLATFRGDITNTGTLSGGRAGVDIYVYGSMAGASAGSNAQIENQGSISGNDVGFHLEGYDIDADFSNTQSSGPSPTPAQITSTNGEGVVLNAWDVWNGNVTNNGGISGSTIGLLIGGDLNSSYGYFEDSFGDFNGNVTNTGMISGGDTGVFISSNNFVGNFENSGTVDGGSVGVVFNVVDDYYFQNKGSFTGNITNTSTGVITGGETAFFIQLGTVDGNFSNTGTIGADLGGEGSSYTGVRIEVDNWTGDLTNEVGGTINGSETGFEIEATVSEFGEFGGDIEGNVTNNGTINGGTTGLRVYAQGNIQGNVTNNGVITAGGGIGSLFVPEFDPGMAVVAATMTGVVSNTNVLDAASNALLVDIGTLTGSVHNTGSITATVAGNTAVLLDIGNGTTFFNDTGGTIDGSVEFDGSAAYVYAAGAGGIAGSLFGQGAGGEGNPNNDTITVAGGTHYFLDNGGEGPSGAYNFSSFTVNNGGVAVMGATAPGDTGGTGYTFSNVDNVVVNNGGEFYIDDQTHLTVDQNYTQAAGGTLSYFLGAPANIATASGIVVAGAGDYGTITMNGTATLDGTIAGYLDPDFVNTNSAVTEVQYDNVLTANGGIIGDFAFEAAIANNSIFQLNSLNDGANHIDLRLTRTSVAHLPSVNNVVPETAGPWKSMVNDRSSPISSAGCGVAGAGWCFNQFAQNEPGASTVMTDASEPDPFAWLRTGVRRVGETAVWGRAVGVWGDTEGDSNAAGSEFDLVGGIVGIDHVFTPIVMAGVAGQWTSMDIDFDGLPDNAEVDSLELGGYVSYGDTRFYVNANASYIWHELGLNRFDPSGTARGDYDGTTFSAYAEMGKIFETYEGFRIQPLVALSYASLETDPYSETGTSLSKMNVSESEFDSLRSQLGARFAYPIELDSGRKMVPEVRAVWAHEFMDTQSSYFATIQGSLLPAALIVGQEYSRDYLILGTGLTAPLSDSTLLFFDYDASMSEDVMTHTISGGFRTKW